MSLEIFKYILSWGTEQQFIDFITYHNVDLTGWEFVITEQNRVSFKTHRKETFYNGTNFESDALIDIKIISGSHQRIVS